MSKICRELKFLIFIYLSIVLLKIIISTQIPYPIYLSDERQYVEMAQNFIREGKFLFEDKPSVQYPPLYSILISPATLLDITLAVPLIKLINSFISTSIVFPAWLLAQKFLDKKNALLTSVLCVFVPESFTYSFTIMSESLFYPLFVLSVYLTIESFQKNETKLDILCGLVIGLCVLTRMIGLVLIVSISFFLLLKIIQNKKYLKKFLILFVSFLVLSPWLFRNIYYFGLSLPNMLGYMALGKTTRVNLTSQLILEIIIVGITNLVYVSFTTGIFPFILCFNQLFNHSHRSRNFIDFTFLSWILFLVIVSVCTYWSFTDLSGTFIGVFNKVMGRYLASVSAIFLLMGIIILYKIKNEIKPVSIFLLAVFFLLVPVNEVMATFDALSTIVIYLPIYLHLISDTIFIKLILISLPFLWIFLFKIIKKRIIFLVLVFLIGLSSISTFAILVGSYDAQEYMEFALWVHSNISRDSTILFDKRLGDSKDEMFWMIRGIKFWTDNKVIIGDLNKIKEFDYVFSTRELNLPLVKQLEAEEGIFGPRRETVFLYKA